MPGSLFHLHCGTSFSLRRSIALRLILRKRLWRHSSISRHPFRQFVSSTARQAPKSTSTPASTSPSIQAQATFPTQSHYSLFPRTLPAGPPPASPFAIDLRALRSEYLRLQASAHPDLHSSHSHVPPPPTDGSAPPVPSQNRPTRAQADALSARINEAYRTLQDQLRRGAYLLSLRGIDVDAEAGQAGVDQALLVEVMGVREEIEELGAEVGARGAEWESERSRMQKENEERIRRCEGAVGTAFERDDIEEARRAVVRLRYWIGVKESLDVLDE